MCGPQLSSTDAATLLRLLVLAPVLEEWVMRAGLQHWLLQRQFGTARTVLATAAAFSLLHAASGPVAALAVFAPGLALGLLYQRTRDWRLCAAVHSLMNAFAMNFCSFF